MTVAKHFTGTYGTMYYVKDVAKTANFYKEKFGFKIAHTSKYWAEVVSPKGQMICLHLADKKMKKLPGGILIQNVTKMNDLMTKLKKKGVKFTGKPHNVHANDFTTHYYKDLDGNEVSIYGTLFEPMRHIIRLTLVAAIAAVASACTTTIDQKMLDEHLTRTYPATPSKCFEATLGSLKDFKIPVETADAKTGKIVTERTPAVTTVFVQGTSGSAVGQTVTAYPSRR